MYKYKLTPYGDEIDIEDGIWCDICGNQIFYGEPYYIYKRKPHCEYCIASNDIEGAIKLECPTQGD